MAPAAAALQARAQAEVSVQGRFFVQNGAQKAPKVEPKGNSKPTKKVMHFLLEKVQIF